MENKPRIHLNSRVTIELIDLHGDAEQAAYILVTSEQADYKSGLLGENTPLGRALHGRCAGETIPYAIGDLREVRVLGVEVSTEEADTTAAEARRAAVQKAANQSEIINQMIFATARGSKWGDYDVDVDRLLNTEENDPAE